MQPAESAHTSDHRLSGVESETRDEFGFGRLTLMYVEDLNRRGEIERAAAGMNDLEGIVHRRIPHRVNRVAQELNDGAMVALDTLVHELEIGR